MTWRVATTVTPAISLTSESSALVACGNSDSAVSARKVGVESTALSNDIAASESLIDSSEAVVVPSAGPAGQRRAVGIMAAADLPIPVAGSAGDAGDDTTAKSPKKDVRGHDTGADIADMEGEIDHLGAKTVLTVGAVDLTGGKDRQTIADPDATDGLKEFVSTEFKVLKKTESKPTCAVVETGPERPAVVEGNVTKNEAADQEAQDHVSDEQDGKEQESVTLPKGSPKEVKNKLALAAPGTGLTSIATTRAASLKVSWLPVDDARATSESISAARDDESLIVLDKAFDDKDKSDQLIKLAKDDKAKELSGGGTLLFPGRHLIATYGYPGIIPLGVMDEDDPEDAVVRVKSYVKQYEKFADDPVLPALEITASVIQADPGPRGDCSEPTPVETLKPHVETMTKADGYVIIDLQSDSADFLDQAKFYEELLKMPNVGLALDPGWKVEPGQVPATQVGHVKTEKINRVVDWLVKLTRKNDLPQKILMLHQFQLQMIRDRETLDLSHPELVFALHVDGHDIPQEKFETWNVILQDLQLEIFEARKDFIDEDQPMFTSEETMNIEPRPWLVTHQQVIDQQKQKYDAK